MPESSKAPLQLRRSTLWPWFVVIVITAVGFAELEIWPLSGFHLFSQARGPQRSELVLNITTGSGSFSATSADLDPAYAKFAWLYTGRTPVTHQRRCTAIIEAVDKSFGTLPEAVDVVRRTYTRTDIDSGERLKATRTLDSCRPMGS